MKRRISIPTTLLLLLAAVGWVFFSPGRAQETGHVALVIQFLDGTIEKRCVDITTEPFRGVDVLSGSGLEFQLEYSSSVGSAVCKIGQNGCASDNCFCDMPNYWSYWHLDKDSNDDWRWLYSQLGASNYAVSTGQVEGWRYGPGQPPDQMPMYEEICLPATATATVTATATATATRTLAPTATFTRPPTSTTAPTSAPNNNLPANPQPQSRGNDDPVTAVVIIIGPTATSTPTATPVPSATPIPPTDTPLPSVTPTLQPTLPPPTTADIVATLPAPTAAATIESPAPVLSQAEPTAPEPTQAMDSPAAEVAIPTPTWSKKNPPSNSGVGIAMMNPTTQAGANPGARPAQPASKLKTVLLITGGLAGAATFLALFAVLSIGLVAIIIWKRR